ncbi:MAG: hypothetical protein KGQ87_09110 [Verrucomicrobia bacterium]|nr:hypothetical protein [Verrucomicrobiota bacterium]
MKALPHLIFLMLMLLGIPVAFYYIYVKTYDSRDVKVKVSAPANPQPNNEIQIKNAEIERLKKENAELKAREQRPLAQPPRPFGQGSLSTNPSSQSPLSQPPRPVGQGSNSCKSYQERGQTNHLHE